MTPLQRKVLLALAVTVFAFVLDVIALKTGFPYGYFWYEAGWGPALFGVPLLTVLGFPVVYFGASAIANRAGVARGVPFLMTVAVVMLAVHLVLDPGAAAQGMWFFRNGGDFYNVPIGNFVGVLFSGSLAAFCFPNTLRNEKLVALLLFFVMGGVIIDLMHGLIAPVIFGLCLVVAAAWFDLRKHGWKS
jgi:uncharacterized membrane protein